MQSPCPLDAKQSGCFFKSQKGQLQYLGNLVLNTDDPYIEKVTIIERNTLSNLINFGDADTYRLVRPFVKVQKPILTADKLEEAKAYLKQNYPNVSDNKIQEMQYVTSCEAMN